MKNFLIAFIFFLMWSALGTWVYTCHVKNLCLDFPGKKTVVTSPKDTIPSREKYDSGFALEQFDDFSIISGTDSVIVSDKSANIEKLLFDFLNKNQDKELLITGLYNKTEKKALGLARAETLKKRFMAYGINPDRIVSESASKDFNFDPKNQYQGGVELKYQDLTEDRNALIEEGITNKILYSHFGSEKFQPDNTLQAYAEELKNYLDKYPEKEVVITGHTDNVGSDEANEWIGMQRAKNVVEYLVSTGIPEEKLEVLSKGPHKPLESNNTLEGRRKNRRIEIKVN
ncbi:OmpA family protein [Sinomicrobium sp. M5D2P17]